MWSVCGQLNDTSSESLKNKNFSNFARGSLQTEIEVIRIQRREMVEKSSQDEKKKVLLVEQRLLRQKVRFFLRSMLQKAAKKLELLQVSLATGGPKNK